MPFLIEMWGIPTGHTMTCRIKRQSDQFFYDLQDGIFKKELDCLNPFLSLSPSESMDSRNIYSVWVDNNSQQFTDGLYTVYFYDSLSPKEVACVRDFTIQGGKEYCGCPPTTTQIAGRILDANVAAHKIKGSVGALIMDIINRLDKIEKKLGV